jgi:hypothetical protein
LNGVAVQVGAFIFGFALFEFGERFLPAVGERPEESGFSGAIEGHREEGIGLGLFAGVRGIAEAHFAHLIMGGAGGISPEFGADVEDRVEAAGEDVFGGGTML